MRKESKDSYLKDKLYPNQQLKEVRELISKLSDNREKLINDFETLFDELIIIKVNSSQEVRNIGNAVDEYLKDAIGNYYQEIAHMEQNKDLEFPIKILLKKIYDKNNSSVVKVLIVSWISFILGIQNLKHIEYLPEIILQLMNMLSEVDKDVYQSAGQCLMRMLIGIEDRFEELSIEHPDIMKSILDNIIYKCEDKDNRVKSYAFEWLLVLLNKYKDIISIYTIEMNKGGKNEILNSNASVSVLIKNIPFSSFDDILGVLICNVALTNNDKQLENLFKNCNDTFQYIILSIPKEELESNLYKITKFLIWNLEQKSNDASMNFIFDWMRKMFKCYNVQMYKGTEDFINKLTSFLPQNNESIFQDLLRIICDIAKFDLSYSKTILHYIIESLSSYPSIIETQGILLLQILSSAIPVTMIYNICANYLLKIQVEINLKIVRLLDIFLLTKYESEPVRKKLKKFNSIERTNDDKEFFEKLFTLWSNKPIRALMLSLVAEYFELSFALVQILAQIDLDEQDYLQLTQVVQIIDNSLFLGLRLKLLDPFKNTLFVKSLFGIVLLLPEGEAFKNLEKRLQCFKIALELYKMDKKQILQLTSPFSEIEISKDKKREVDHFIAIFMKKRLSNSQNLIKKNKSFI